MNAAFLLKRSEGSEAATALIISFIRSCSRRGDEMGGVRWI